MWRFKQFMPKEHTGLEGRTIDIGTLKINVRNAIAEGGFSCVYLAREALHGSKQYALKHIICNDEESLQLVMKEISVMNLLKGNPNIVTLYAHTFFDMGRTKEALLVMEYCEKSLVNVLESRGAGFFEERQILTIFRDVCNAVFAMHCQTPPIAHRDLKAENILLGSDGLWKLCDFGSTSTNHKRFEKPEEMGIEEDNIRKHTTPAYRAPEMWDLFRREVINEKVDIWALGCLLFRICYLRSAFDGESKLQVLNGNYRIPELPKYSTSITNLIRDMLESSPDARPDITQVWFRVNDLLPSGLQKSLPDRPPQMQQQGTEVHEGFLKPTSKSNAMPRRSPPPPPPAARPAQNVSVSAVSPTTVGGSPVGAFWNTQHAKDSVVEDEIRPKYDEEPSSDISARPDRSGLEKVHNSKKTSPSKEGYLHSQPVKKHLQGKSVNRVEDGALKDFEINFFQNPDRASEKPKASNSDSTPGFENEEFNAFVAEFSSSKVGSQRDSETPLNKELLEAEVERLKEQLKKANLEKAEITSKYEKLSAICRSQRQELQELKQAVSSRTPSPNRDVSRHQTPSGSQSSITPPQEKSKGTAFEPQLGFDSSSPNPESQSWQAFADDSMPQTVSINTNSRSVRTRNGHQNKQATSGGNAWGFETETFTAVPPASSHTNSTTTSESKRSQRVVESKNIASKPTSQPAGWAGF